MKVEPISPPSTSGFPPCWLLLAESLRVAISPRSMTFALVGTLLTSATWQLAGGVFLAEPRTGTIADYHARVSRWPGEGEVGGLSDYFPPAWRPMLPSPRPLDPIFGVQTRLVEPFRRVVRSPDLGWSALGYYLFGGVVSIAIWALFGGAITRTTIVHLGLARRTGLWDAFTFARGKWLDLFAAPTLPLVALAAIGLPFVVLGWLCRSDVGVALAGVFWAICVISGLLMAILALGLLFGWPLMWGAVACEDSDAFDAISRAYAYTFQRPMHYLYYGLCAGVLGVLGWLLAWYFVESIVTLCYWGANWGSGGKRLAEIQRAMSGDAAELSPLLWIGARLISLWVGLVRSAAGAFSFAYFWSASAAIYLLLRKDTDNTELDDVCPLTPREG